MSRKEDMLWERKDEQGVVQCNLCARRCLIAPGQRGVCGVRENQDGALYSHVYDRVVAEGVDPIEKKPLYHFLPGSRTYSVAAEGCNFRCLHCQNAAIAQPPRGQVPLPGRARTPVDLVRGALRNDCASIAYTYTEPTVFFEYALDTARLASAEGIRNVFVTNGYMTREARELLAPWVHGVNIDLKSFREDFYERVCGVRLAPVLETIEGFFRAGVWLELTTLVIPGLNDSDEEMEELARFILDLSPDIPWHVSAFHPTHKMLDRPPTPPTTLQRARCIGMQVGLRHVYTGNVELDGGGDTHCPACKDLLIARRGSRIERFRVRDGGCPSCGHPVAGVWT